MRLALVLIVLVFPLVDLWGLYQIMRAFGPLLMVCLVVIAAFAGVFIIRQERLRMGPRLHAMLAGGDWSLPELLYTFRRLAAGILLVFPGVLSDILAIVLLLLPERARPAGFDFRPGAEAARGPAVIEGEFREIDAASDASARELPPR